MSETFILPEIFETYTVRNEKGIYLAHHLKPKCIAKGHMSYSTEK